MYASGTTFFLDLRLSVFPLYQILGEMAAYDPANEREGALKRTAAMLRPLLVPLVKAPVDPTTGRVAYPSWPPHEDDLAYMRRVANCSNLRDIARAVPEIQSAWENFLRIVRKCSKLDKTV